MVPMTTQQNIGTVTMVTSIPAAWRYKRLYIPEFGSSGDQSEIQAAVRYSQRDVVQKEFNVRAAIINCNYKEMPINQIIRSGTHYH
jgi:hypothetical protein